MTKKSQLQDSRPVKSKEDMNNLLEALNMSKAYGNRNVLLWKLGVSTGLRISDIVGLKVEQVFGKSRFTITEHKTSKKRIVHIESLMPLIAEFISDNNLGADDYLFKSRKGSGHISVIQAYRIINTAGNDAGLTGITTHSMRRTFGYMYYKQFNDIGSLMLILNHSSVSETLKYIGVTEEAIAHNISALNVFG